MSAPHLSISVNSLYPATNNLRTTLFSNPGTGPTIVVSSTNGFPSQGLISIEDEVIYYASKTATQFQSCTRGYDSTINVQHGAGLIVEQRWVAAHHNAVSNEIIRIEQVLGADVATSSQGTAYNTVDARLDSYDTIVVVSNPPASGRVGQISYATATNLWYVYNGSDWSVIALASTSVSDQLWQLITNSPGVTEYAAPIVPSFVSNVAGTLYSTGTISNYLNSFSGYAVLGLDDSALSLKTQSDTIVRIIDSDRLSQPYLMSFNIDYPDTDKISVFAIVPDGGRIVRKVYLTSVGTGSVSISINKLTPPASYSASVALTTIGVTLVDSVTPAYTYSTIGSWNSGVTISSGDLVYARVVSVTGAPSRVTATVDAPYYHE